MADAARLVRTRFPRPNSRLFNQLLTANVLGKPEVL